MKGNTVYTIERTTCMKEKIFYTTLYDNYSSMKRNTVYCIKSQDWDNTFKKWIVVMMTTQ
jgi:hypothetical protein